MLAHLNNVHIGPVCGNSDEEESQAQFVIPRGNDREDLGDLVGIKIGKVTGNGTIIAEQHKFIQDLWVQHSEFDLNIDSGSLNISVTSDKNSSNDSLTHSVPVRFEQISGAEHPAYPIQIEDVGDGTLSITG